MFLSGILGLDAPFLLGPFAVVTVGDDLTLDFMETEGDITPQHYAFLVSETDFDEIFARIKARRLAYWADPLQKKSGRINSWDDGRGVYFEDPDGHLLEILTRPYGSAGTSAEHPHPLVAKTLDGDDEAISQEAAVSERARGARGMGLPVPSEEANIAVARASYEAYVTKDRSALEALIAEDFHFTSPLDNRIDRVIYFQRCWPNSERTERFDFIHLVPLGDRIFVTYEGRAAGKRFRNTEILTLRGGRIVDVEVYFGWSIPHEARAGGFVDES